MELTLLELGERFLDIDLDLSLWAISRDMFPAIGDQIHITSCATGSDPDSLLGLSINESGRPKDAAIRCAWMLHGPAYCHGERQQDRRHIVLTISFHTMYSMPCLNHSLLHPPTPAQCQHPILNQSTPDPTSDPMKIERSRFDKQLNLNSLASLTDNALTAGIGAVTR